VSSMKWKYECPLCGADVNPAGPVTLVAVREGVRTLFGFHPEPGNYENYMPEGMPYIPGERWDFLCPVCHGDLRCANHETLCELIQKIGPTRLRLLFSRVAGERATYVISEKAETTSMGQDADRYDDTVRLRSGKVETLP